MYSVLYIYFQNKEDIVDREFGFYLKKIFQMAESELNKDLENIDLTSSQAKLLIYLYKNRDNPINQRDIEKEFSLTNPTVNGILNRLESKKFIQRKVSSIDARNKEIILSDKSIVLITELEKKAKNMENKLIANIEKEKLNIFYEVIKQIFNNIQGGN